MTNIQESWIVYSTMLSNSLFPHHFVMFKTKFEWWNEVWNLLIQKIVECLLQMISHYIHSHIIIGLHKLLKKHNNIWNLFHQYWIGHAQCLDDCKHHLQIDNQTFVKNYTITNHILTSKTSKNKQITPSFPSHLILMCFYYVHEKLC